MADLEAATGISFRWPDCTCKDPFPLREHEQDCPCGPGVEWGDPRKVLRETAFYYQQETKDAGDAFLLHMFRAELVAEWFARERASKLGAGMPPARIMIIDDLVADLDQLHDYLVSKLDDGANNELDDFGRLTDAVEAAAKFLWALKYEDASTERN
jgi:hypothetical protein